MQFGKRAYIMSQKENIFFKCHLGKGILSKICSIFFFFFRNKLVRQQREDNTLQLAKVMTYTTWEGGLWGTDSDIYYFFLLTLSENVQCRISQVSH